MLPVSDPPIDEDREWLLKDHRGTGGAKNTRGSSYAITKRGAYAALSYMSCAGALLFPNFRIWDFSILSSNSPIIIILIDQIMA